MHQRPMHELINALRKLGANITCEDVEGFFPLKIEASELRGGEIDIDASVSSQFISALMMIAPKLKDGLHIHFKNKPASFSYLQQTVAIMKKYSIDVELNESEVLIRKQKISPAKFNINGDWSSASFFICMAALSNHSDFLMKNISTKSIQGDEVLLNWMTDAGLICSEIENGIRVQKTKPLKLSSTYSLFSTPDLAQPLAVMCAALNHNVTFNGTQNLRLKETDRVTALHIELKKCGVDLAVGENEIVLKGKFHCAEETFETYNDHRMLMSLAILSLKCGQVYLKNPGVVKKSFPDFFQQMKNLGFTVLFQ